MSSSPFDNAPTPIVVDAVRKHTATVIFAHGLGDNGGSYQMHVSVWRRMKGLDHIKFVLPTAPSIPITCNMGMRMPGWYDVAVLGSDMARLKAAEDQPGIEGCRDYFQRLIQAEVDAGIPAERVVLGGFSQGGAISLFTALTSPLRLGGVVALSTYVPLTDKYFPGGQATAQVSAANKDTPFIMRHGTADPVVPLPLAEKSRELLESQGYKVDWKTYPGMSHSCWDEVEEFLEVATFLDKVLPPLEEAKPEAEAGSKSGP